MAEATEKGTKNSPRKDHEEDQEFILTPEIMAAENHRIDLVLVVGALVFAFFLGSYTDTGPDTFTRLRTGQLIDQTFPDVPRTDTLTYTAEGRPWINPSWLFDWLTYLV